jgi:hypothetical protein
MPLLPADYQKVCIHEASHAVIAVARGFSVFSLMLDGPDHKPAAVWRESPPGQYVETSQVWARNEVDVLLAGQLGEAEFYNAPNPAWLGGAGGDEAQIDYAALWAVGSQAHLNTARASGLDSSLWRTRLLGLPWAAIDALIAARRPIVSTEIHNYRGAIEKTAQALLANSHVSGRVVYDEMGVAWPGTQRTAAWVAIP